MGKIKDIDTKWQESLRSAKRKKSFKVPFNIKELTILVRYPRRRSECTRESYQDLVHSSKEY